MDMPCGLLVGKAEDGSSRFQRKVLTHPIIHSHHIQKCCNFDAQVKTQKE